MKKISAIIILILTLISCKEKTNENPSEKNMTNEFISRIHTPELETDFYRILGMTSLEKHTADFQKINWKKDFWREYESGNFNMTDLEVFNRTDSKYLSIGTAPNMDDTFQFVIGLGTHKETNDKNNPIRKTKLYFTETENTEVPEKLIELFFKGDYSNINSELNTYEMDEIEDLYLNIK